MFQLADGLHEAELCKFPGTNQVPADEIACCPGLDDEHRISQLKQNHTVAQKASQISAHEDQHII